MKRLLPLAIAILFASNYIAQAQPGYRFVDLGFNINGSSQLSEDDNTGYETRNSYFYSSLNLSYGKFISESKIIGIAVGASTDFTKFTSTNPISAENNFDKISNTFSITPYLRKYYPLSDKLYFNSTFSVRASYSIEDHNRIDITDFNSFDIGISANPGLTYFVNDRWLLNGSIGSIFLDRSQNTSGDKWVDYDYGLNFGSNTYRIGFSYLIQPRNKS